jgi:PqqD family protein of HPr-rel-A system
VQLRFAPAPGLLIEELGDAWVAFSPMSGETVFINDASAAIIEALSEEANDRASVAAALAADTGLSQDELATQIEDAWPRLMEGGLIVAYDAA